MTEYSIPNPEGVHPAGDHRAVAAPQITQKSLNRDILALISKPGKVWTTIFVIDILILLAALIALRNMIVTGLGTEGWTRPVMWS